MISLEGKNIEYEWKKNKLQVRELLRELKLNGELVVVKVNGRVVTEFDEVKKEDKIELVRVSSGG